MPRAPRRSYLIAGVAITGSSLVAVSSVTPPVPDVGARAVQLTSADSADSPRGDGVALVMGGSGIRYHRSATLMLPTRSTCSPGICAGVGHA
ncbi:MAG: hypothetical protein ACRDTV_12820 [Mycobacterium sp.]